MVDQSRRIAYDRSIRKNIFSDHRAHPHNGSSTDHQRSFVTAVLKDRAGADKSVVSDMNISVAFNTRSKSHEVPDDTIVRDIGKIVGMKEFANPNIRCHGSERR